MILKERDTQSKKEYWIRIRLSDLYFWHPFATNEQIEKERQRRADAQIKLAYNQTR